MASPSPRSSADEGEIVERQGSGHFKAKTTATVVAEDGVDSFNVDRRDRLRRGRSPRSPPRRSADSGADRPPRPGHRGPAAFSSYPYRNTSPRGLKRQRERERDERDAPSGRSAGGARGGRHDDGFRDDRRRDAPRNGPRMNDDRRRGGGRDSDRGFRHYDDDGAADSRYDGGRYHPSNGYGRDQAGKRQRTRSRSPPPPSSSFSRGNGNRERNERDRHDRDRDFDRNRDRDYDRHDREDGRFDRRPARDYQPTASALHNGPKRLNGVVEDDETKSAKSVSFDAAAKDGESSHAPNKTNQLPEDWVESQPIDEEAEIRRRRQRREEILRKSRASTPSLTPSLEADKTAAPAAVESKTQGTAPVTGNNTPRSFDATATASPASPSAVSQDQAAVDALNLTDDQNFFSALGKNTAGGGGSGAANTTEDGPSAADYDPTVDMEEDERRDELRHGGTLAGLHGMEIHRRPSTLAEVDREGLRRDSEPSKAAAPESRNGATPGVARQDGRDEGGNEDDEDDMFAEDFVEKHKAPKAQTQAAAPTANDAGENGAAVSGLPALAANGGGILEGDDQQGYYKIRRGEVLDGRYQIQSTLGKGMFSGVARAWDITSSNKKVVAIKIMRNNDALRKGGYTEIAILQKLNETDPANKKHIVRFERSFDYRGHLCMCFENLSMNLREVLKKFGNNVGINLHGVRVYAYQILVALAHMRRCSIIHADLKPDNILVSDNRSTLKICDLGTAIDRSDAATAHMEITPYLVSRFYRAPEIILGMPYDYAVDMWSIGCTLYELYTGKILFTGESNNQMLRAIMEVRGKISGKLYRRGELWRMHFDDTGNFLSQEHDKFQGKTTVKILPVIKVNRDLRTRLMAASAGMDDAETKDLSRFYDLLDRCLSLNPDKRILPSDALKHPFFTSKS
ncbi:serine/threonine-protein kinase [Niveomyces insectorum RCEF 264]|uniref:non-specific serine/threonine protein kinase n=1 Tax=Niveomyces insectorum RCEF 264 TaxID=1081102 RepID=A0A167RF63_9HYPO|nr:serine/threonine-protein kinase [Niveomyces insectorum RCEF 264]